MPQMEKQRQQHSSSSSSSSRRRRRHRPPAGTPARRSRRAAGSRSSPARRRRPASRRRRRRRPAPIATRERVLAATPRVAIETPRAQRLDRAQGRPHRRPRAHPIPRDGRSRSRPPIVLLSPSGSPHPFYAEFGWVGAAGANVKLPDADTVWTPAGLRHARRRPAGHAHLRQRRGPRVPPHHRGRRQVPVHGQDEVANKGGDAGHALSLRADLAPRHAGDARLLHPARGPDRRARRQGPAGDHLQRHRGEEARSRSRSPTRWLGITDKYWAATLLPDPRPRPAGALLVRARLGSAKTYQTDYLLDAVDGRARRDRRRRTTRLFAGAKEVAIVDAYDKALKLNRFELLIDWGWFYFITKPMF